MRKAEKLQKYIESEEERKKVEERAQIEEGEYSR
jgi:hypothetical protein